MFNFGFKYLAQDKNGDICFFRSEPITIKGKWFCDEYFCVLEGRNSINDWQQRIVNLEAHWFKIEDGLLVQTNKRPHADLAVKYFLDDNVEVEYFEHPEWEYTNEPVFDVNCKYREKPKPTPEKEIWYRNYLDDDGSIKVLTSNISVGWPPVQYISKPKKLKIKP